MNRFSFHNIGQLQRREKNEQDEWIFSWTILTLNHTYGFIFIYTKENGPFWMDKLGTQATFNYTYFILIIENLYFQKV